MSGRLRPAEREAHDLAVGTLVVYGGHGVGRVSARGSDDGGDADGPTVVVEFSSGLSVTLPLERARTCLRPPAGAGELDAVSAALGARSAPVEPSWQARTRTARAKIALGDPVVLAEVVRDAVERQRRLAPGSSLSSLEQELYKKARALLAAELTVAVGIDHAEAESWIERHLERDAHANLHA